MSIPISAPFGEFLGTALLILLGNGVVANVVLKGTKGNQSGWMVITAGWAFAVTMGIYLVNSVSGAHLNPAVTLGLAVIGKLEWASVGLYVLGQLLGAFFGAWLVWVCYYSHWELTQDPDAKRAVFCTAPAVRNPGANFFCEIIATFVLVLGVLAISSPKNLIPDSGFAQGFGPVLVGLLVWSIGLSLGGPTGFAINPARDLAPRLFHSLFPISGKGGSDWGYAWIPVFGPIIGGILGAIVYAALWPSP